jgi:peroxiredoxin
VREREQVDLFAISPDTPEQSRAFIEKIEADGKGRVTFTLLSDRDSAVIDRYNLRDPAYAGEQFEGIPHPAVFVLDREGIVRWSKVETDYTQRPENSEIRDALDALR